MAGKRSASSDLNHDNWDDDIEPEEAGTFKKAPDAVLQTRVFKAAKRRNAGASGEEKKMPNVFSNFTGFAAATSTSPAKAFGFLANPSTTPDSTPASSSKLAISTQNGFTPTTTTSTPPTTTNTNGSGNQTEYYAKLKGLNESVSQWIKTHVDENPLCNLTPVFRDYEKYLKEIEDYVSWSTDTPVTKDSFPKPTPPSTFSFGTQKTETETKPANPFVTSFGNTAAFGSTPPKPFSFGGDKPFAFANVAPPPAEPKEEEESDEPPKVEFTKVVEDGSIHSVRCKVFAKKDKDFVERGVGQLYLKPIEGSNKTQLIVRADTNLGNLIMNVVLSKSIPTSRQGKNHVMIVCVPTPEAAAKAKKDESPLQTMLIKVKTAEDADKLLETIEKCKK